MGGIVGIYGPKESNYTLEAMAKRIAHRGTIDKKEFIEKPWDVVEKNESEGNNIAFNGALMNQNRLTKDETDAAFALRLYKEMGDSFLSELEGVFALTIYDAEKGLLLARDSLGSVPLYYGISGKSCHFASEIKAFRQDLTCREVPPGSSCRFKDSAEAMSYFEEDESNCADDKMLSKREAIERINCALEDTVKELIARYSSLGLYLSGGLDSSIIAAVVSKEVEGVPSFAVGVKGSEDLAYARLCADYLGTSHHEYCYDIDDMMEVLPLVIYHLESYDAALVRSSVPNFMLARMASKHVDTVLSGEGADEIFCGYSYMKQLEESKLQEETIKLLKTLHNTGLQRGDRMAAAFGLEARAPFLAKEMIHLGEIIPSQQKISLDGTEKMILREAFADSLPFSVICREKQKFSVGAGSSEMLNDYAESNRKHTRYSPGTLTPGGHVLQSWEESMYFEIFKNCFPNDTAEQIVGFTEHL